MKSILKKFIAPTIITAGAIIGVLLTTRTPHAVVAGPNDNVTGWALSDMANGADQTLTPGYPYGGKGLGWISMNDTNVNAGGGSYGINLGTDGKFTGKAWSENGGWLDFNPGGLPSNAGTMGTATTSGASVSAACLATNAPCQVTGWIRFTGAPTDPWNGGWDGWVSMSGTNYKVMLGAPVTDVNDPTVQTRTLSGYAWGDKVAGWINFQWAKVTIRVPQCPLPLVENPNNTGQVPPDCVCPVTFLPPVNGSCTSDPRCPVPAPDPNYPAMGSAYNSLCSCAPRSGHPEDCAPIKGCMIVGDPNNNPLATIPDNTMCFCPSGGYDSSTNSCPGDPCRDKIDNDRDGKIDAQDPSECPVKGPKTPVYIET